VTIVCCSSLLSQANSHHNLKIGFNVGAGSYFGSTQKPPQIREYNSMYDDDFYCGVILPSGTTNSKHLGINAEYYILKNRVGLSAGLKFTQFQTTLESDGDYFLWNQGQEGLITDYLSIRKITQNNYYLGLPADMKFFINRSEKICNMYLKIGGSLNFKVSDHNSVNFLEESMNEFEMNVLNELSDTKSCYSNVFFAIGLKMIRFRETWKGFPQFNVEFRMLDLILTNKYSSFIDSDVTAGIGMQISVQIPLGKNVPIGTR
jgi:hypothetical protein